MQRISFLHTSLAGIITHYDWDRVSSREQMAQVIALLRAAKAEDLWGPDTEVDHMVAYVKGELENQTKQGLNVVVLVIRGEIAAVMGYWIGTPSFYASHTRLDFLAVGVGLHPFVKEYAGILMFDQLREIHADNES